MNRRDMLAACGALIGGSLPLWAGPAGAGTPRWDPAWAKDLKESGVPGAIVYHVPARTMKYVGSPGIVILPDGTYLAKCDLFGPASNEYVRPTTLVFSSIDGGNTWSFKSGVKGLFWASIFHHCGSTYMMGTSRCMGHAVIVKSDDGGESWSTPRDDKSGLIIKDWSHTAPVPVVVHEGRLWRAMEKTSGPFPWDRRFSAFMASAPEDANLLRADSWTLSERLAFDQAWLVGRSPLCDWPRVWLEGNAVEAPDGGIVDVLRIDQCGEKELAAIVRIGPGGREASFDPANGFIEFPGGAKKFTIRHDPRTDRYWTMANAGPESCSGGRDPFKVRNAQTLISSSDLVNWKIERTILHHPDVKRHAFQYVDWVFEGNDIILVSRTAFDDGMGGAHDFHDANFLTFHRVRNFRVNP